MTTPPDEETERLAQKLADALMTEMTRAMQLHEAETLRAIIPAIQELPIHPHCRIIVAGWMAALAEGLEAEHGIDEQPITRRLEEIADRDH